MLSGEPLSFRPLDFQEHSPHRRERAGTALPSESWLLGRLVSLSPKVLIYVTGTATPISHVSLLKDKCPIDGKVLFLLKLAIQIILTVASIYKFI